MSPEPRRAPTPEFILACQRADVKDNDDFSARPEKSKNFRKISKNFVQNS